MKKILIIGGCGYIGSKLFNYLQDNNYLVSSIDIELFGNPNVKNNKENFKNISKETLSEYSDVILLAGHSSVKMCETNLIGCFRNNVQYVIDLIFKLSKNQKLIYASSSSVYGNINRSLAHEDCEEYNAGSFYDLSKAEIDHYFKIIDKIQYYGLRFGTVNGSSPNLRTDIMINSMFSSAINNGFINVSNPSLKRPILDIRDLCKAVVKIIENGTFENRGIYNLASFNSSVETIARKVSESTGAIINTIDEDKKPSKTYDFAISCEKFIKSFDFQFDSSVESITKDLKENYTKSILIGRRDTPDIII
jgi:nucleoside-diphosphate-sugar epimerase